MYAVIIQMHLIRKKAVFAENQTSPDNIYLFHPQRVIHQRVLPHLFLEFPNHAMIPFVLPNVLLIAEDCSNQEFVDLIFPELKKIFPVQEPVQVMLCYCYKVWI